MRQIGNKTENTLSRSESICGKINRTNVSGNIFVRTEKEEKQITCREGGRNEWYKGIISDTESRVFPRIFCRGHQFY